MQKIQGSSCIRRWYRKMQVLIPSSCIRRCRLDLWIGNIPWSRKWQPALVFLLGKFHGQRSLVGNSHGAVGSWTQLSDWHSTAQYPHNEILLGNKKEWSTDTCCNIDLEKIYAEWKKLIIELGFPGGSVGKEFTCSVWDCLQYRRAGFNPWIRKFPWRRKWQPPLVFLSGKFLGQRSVAGSSP